MRDKSRQQPKTTRVRLYSTGVAYDGNFTTGFIAAIDNNTVAFRVQGLEVDLTEEIILQTLVQNMKKLRPKSESNPVKEPKGRPDKEIVWAKKN